MPFQFTCSRCQREYTRPVSRPSNFCSYACKNAAQSNRVERQCQQCGASFSVKASALVHDKAEFCSRPCYFASRAGKCGNRFRDGRYVSSGYVNILMRDHPHADEDGYVLEHRVVMEAVIGRLLTPKEHVHHINGVKSDNRPENLQVVSKGEHTRIHNLERSLRNQPCSVCGKPEHLARGMCKRCYDHWRYLRRKHPA